MCSVVKSSRHRLNLRMLHHPSRPSLSLSSAFTHSLTHPLVRLTAACMGHVALHVYGAKRGEGRAGEEDGRTKLGERGERAYKTSEASPLSFCPPPSVPLPSRHALFLPLFRSFFPTHSLTHPLSRPIGRTKAMNRVPGQKLLPWPN